MIELTGQEIEQDITGFKARISAAQSKLESLPDGYLDFKKHKKREQQRRELEGEIEHIKNLIKIATEALNEVL